MVNNPNPLFAMKVPVVSEALDLKQYFRDQGLDLLAVDADRPGRNVNEMKVDQPYRPELADLYRLHRFILDYRRVTILEFGTGYSSLVMANALAQNARLYSQEVSQLRRNNPFQLHSVDNEQKYIQLSQSRIPKDLRNHAYFHFSKVSMDTFCERVCTYYDQLPLVNPDFIYLDGPDNFNVVGDIAGWSTRHNDMMPMSADILRIEHFLTPGTIIVVDGRAANARFLKSNLQRTWLYQYNEIYDQHIFMLDEPPLGKYNRRQLEFYKKGAS